MRFLNAGFNNAFLCDKPSVGYLQSNNQTQADKCI